MKKQFWCLSPGDRKPKFVHDDFTEEHLAGLVDHISERGMHSWIYFYTEEVDYEELLNKYSEHVGICEGTDFIGDHHRRYSASQGLIFTDAEWAVLTMVDE